MFFERRILILLLIYVIIITGLFLFHTFPSQDFEINPTKSICTPKFQEEINSTSINNAKKTGNKPPEKPKEEELINDNFKTETKEETELMKDIEFTLGMDRERTKFYQERREKEDEIIKNRTPKERSLSDPVKVNIHCGNCRWDHLNFFDPSWVHGCSVPCSFRSSEENILEADLVLSLENPFLDRHIKAKYEMPSKTKYGFMAMESFCNRLNLCNGVEHYNITKFKECFDTVDMMVSFHRESDVVMNYGYGLSLPDEHHFSDQDIENYMKKLNSEHLQNNTRDINDTLTSTWISNCAPLRQRYIQLLSNLIPIDHYGACLRNKDGSQLPKVQQQQRYKFSLAMENSIENDYATEKYFQGILSNNIMIYFGSPSIKDFSPAVGKKVFINALDYSPSKLAEIMKELDKNNTKYLEYFEWKKNPISSSFIDLVKKSFLLKGKEGWQCRICEYYHKRFD